MPRYFTTITGLNNPKNKLEDAIQSFFMKNRERIFDTTEDKNKFVKSIGPVLDKAHKDHSRCKPVELGFRKGVEHKSLYYIIDIPGGSFLIHLENTRHGY